MKIIVFGMEGRETAQLIQKIDQVSKKRNLSVYVAVSENIGHIFSYGIEIPPSIAIEQDHVLAARNIDEETLTNFLLSCIQPADFQQLSVNF